MNAYPFVFGEWDVFVLEVPFQDVDGVVCGVVSGFVGADDFVPRRVVGVDGELSCPVVTDSDERPLADQYGVGVWFFGGDEPNVSDGQRVRPCVAGGVEDG